MTGFLKTLPKELFEAAAVVESGPWRTYRSIVIPVSVPSLSATAIFLFVIHWNDLLYPLLFIQDAAKRTIPVALLSFQGEFLTDYPLHRSSWPPPHRPRLRVPAALLRRRHHRRRREGLTVTDTPSCFAGCGASVPTRPASPSTSTPSRCPARHDARLAHRRAVGGTGVETRMPNLPMPSSDRRDPVRMQVTAPDTPACGSSSRPRGHALDDDGTAWASSSIRHPIPRPSRSRATNTVLP